MFTKNELQAAEALKSIARNQEVKRYVQESKELYPLLLKAAKRFVTGEIQEDGISKAQELISKGYSVSLEYIGENTTSVEECLQAKYEFNNLMEKMGSITVQATISFDLSHIGLNVSSKLALENLTEMAQTALSYDLTLMISMEESAKTDDILDIYKKVAIQYSNVGITIQTHLNRSMNDIEDLLNYPGKIRIVKGAYQEPSDIAIVRSKELNERYLNLIAACIQKRHPVSIATHDEEIIKEILKQQYLSLPNVEVEMLYGVRPDLMKQLNGSGHKTRVYLTYGHEWYLYLCHRLAEYPPNIYQALVDMIRRTTGDSDMY